MLSPTYAALRLYSAPLRLEVMGETAAQELSLRTRPEDIFPDPTVSYRFPWLDGTRADFLAFQRGIIAHLPTGPAHSWCVKFVARRAGALATGPAAAAREGVPAASGAPVGCIDLRCSEGVLSTGSYIFTEHQGQGLGTRMRLMVADFAFRHLGFPAIHSETQPGNLASESVSRRCGYVRQKVHDDGSSTWTLTPQALPPVHCRAYHAQGVVDRLRYNTGHENLHSS